MASRPVMIAALVGASVGVPYVVSESRNGAWGLGGEAAEATPAGDSSGPASGQPAGKFAPAYDRLPTRVPGPPIFANSTPREGQQVHSIEQVFRFDLTKGWVYGNWDRKSTGSSDDGLESVRVPLVTGTRVHDLAGALTYFFNAAGRVEHIAFHGRTGDPKPLVAFLARTYEFRREDAPPGEELYRVRRTGRPQSELRARPEAVLRSSSPHGSFVIDLELARPGSNRLLPPSDVTLDIPGVGTALERGGPSHSVQAKPGESSFLDRVRFATPEEQDQLYRMRWPN